MTLLQVQLSCPWGGHARGAVLDLEVQQAAELLEAGLAQPTDPGELTKLTAITTDQPGAP